MDMSGRCGLASGRGIDAMTVMEALVVEQRRRSSERRISAA